MLPKGWAHMEIVSITAITFPINACGVLACTKDIACTEKIVENIIMAKQQTTITR